MVIVLITAAIQIIRTAALMLSALIDRLVAHSESDALPHSSAKRVFRRIQICIHASPFSAAAAPLIRSTSG
jgi:hypothetical protein